MASNFRNLSGGQRSPRRAGTYRRPLVEMKPRKPALRKLRIKSSIREMTGVRVRVKNTRFHGKQNMGGFLTQMAREFSGAD
jgi:hypothetical protein